MKKLSVLLVALAVAVSASAGVGLKANRVVKSNKLTPKTEMTKNPVKMSQLKGKNTRFQVINEQPQGEVKTYQRSGGAIYPSGNSIYSGTQDGRMEIVYAEDGKVYMKNLLYNTGSAFGDYWIEGQLNEEGTEITIQLGQSIYWSNQYLADVVLCWGETRVDVTEEGAYLGITPDERVTEVVYTIDGEIIHGPEGIAPDPTAEVDYPNFWATGLSCVWTDDGSFGGGLEWNTVLTETEPFVIPDVIYDIPEGCQVYDYYRSSYCIYNSWFGIGLTETDGKIHVAFDMTNGDVYIQNPSWWHDGNNTWVKGTYDWMTGIITVPTGQYLAFYEEYEYGIQLGWGSSYVYEEEDGYYLGTELDERTTEIQFMIDDDYLYLLGCEGDAEAEFPNNYNATGLMTYYSDDLSWTSLEFVTHDEPMGEIVNVVPAVPANPTADDWYDCGNENGYSRFYFTLPTEDIDGNKLDLESISYSIYTDDDEIFTFDANTYTYDLTDDMTEIPYWIYSDAVDFSSSGVYFYRTNRGNNPLFQNRIGIQVHYTVNGEKNSSDIVYLEVAPAAPAIPDNPENLTWSDCGDESGYSRFGFTLPSTDIDGNPIDPYYMSYSIFTDNDEIFTFDAATYSTDLDQDMTEIPYDIFSNAWDFYSGAVYFYRTNEGENGEEPLFTWRIGIQVYYTVDGVKNASDIVYLEVFPHTGVNEMNAGKTVANVRYFNVAGQEMAQPEGLTIQVTTYTDGTSSAVKVVK